MILPDMKHNSGGPTLSSL